MDRKQKILIIDFGSQYTHLIARRIRQLGAYSEIVPYDGNIDLSNVRGLILSGGPMSVYDENSPTIPKSIIIEAIKQGIPILGICYGHQLLAKMFGGNVTKSKLAEYGKTEFIRIRKSRLFDGTPKRFFVWMNHADIVVKLPEEFLVVGATNVSPVAAFEMKNQLVFGVQFHPEVSHTQYGLTILKNFIKICSLEGTWIKQEFIREKISKLRSLIKDKSVLIATSGGVDSVTTAVLIKEAIGPNNIYLVIIDTGFLRENEVKIVEDNLRMLGFKNIFVVDAKERFLERLIGCDDPREKRAIFARTYFEVLEEVARKIREIDPKLEFLAQGTIYPDKVESAKTGKSKSKIKQHHNTALETLSSLKIIEPLEDLYKDEVRSIALELGVPKEIVNRQPFPGPGLLIRIVGKITREKIEIIRKAHRIVDDETNKYGIEGLWQIFPVLLSIKTTGIKGDRGVYEYVMVIRAVHSEDGMTADFARLPWDFLEKLTSRLTGELPICRVLYDITSKPPATIEFE